MAKIKNLYFIAIIPNVALRTIVKEFKEEMSKQFNAKHALKSQAHITLQMPFKRYEKEEATLIEALENFSKNETKFEILLNGFDCFPPRVIFLKVENHKPIIGLHERLKKILIDNLDFDKNERTEKLHPHMTIATRDLKKEKFNLAWETFKEREFSVQFATSSIFLLKHNGKFWEIFREFQFGS